MELSRQTSFHMVVFDSNYKLWFLLERVRKVEMIQRNGQRIRESQLDDLKILWVDTVMHTVAYGIMSFDLILVPHEVVLSYVGDIRVISMWHFNNIVIVKEISLRLDLIKFSRRKVEN